MLNVLVVIDKLSIDGETPTCIALNLRDTYPLMTRKQIRPAVCDLRGEDPGADLLEQAGIPVFRLGLPPSSPRVAGALRRVAEQWGASLIHAHGYASANFGRWVGKRLGIPVFVHEHGIMRVRADQWLADRFCRPWTTLGLAVSGAVADFMVRGRSIPRERIEVLPNGVDLHRFFNTSAESPDDCRRALGLPVGVPLAGAAGRFRREKGMDVFIEAAARVVDSVPKAHFVLAGEGPERGLLENLAARRGLNDRLIFPGFVEDVPRLMRAFSLLVIPSRSEGFGFVALEAMAAGIPVIAARVGGLPEIVANGANGLLCPPENPAALADAIRRLLSDPQERETLGARGRKASEAYSMERYVDRLSALYHEWSGRTHPVVGRRSSGQNPIREAGS